MKIRDAFRLFGRKREEQLAELAYLRCKNDPGIILADDFTAAAMIREDGVRMVRIDGQAFESTPLLQKIERAEFFDNLKNLVRNAVEPSSNVDRRLPEPAYEERVAVEAVIHDHCMLRAKMDGLGFKQFFSAPVIHTAFHGATNMNRLASAWHSDDVNVVSACLHGTGTEYLEGAITAQDRSLVAQGARLPSRIRARTTGPGEILVLHGREVSRNEKQYSDDLSAQIHRGGSLEGRRVVMLYSLGPE